MIETMDDYLRFIKVNRKLPQGGHRDRIENLLSLSNEVGELQGLYKKRIRDNLTISHTDLISELGDVLYSILYQIELENLTLDDVILFNINKLKERGARE